MRKSAGCRRAAGKAGVTLPDPYKVGNPLQSFGNHFAKASKKVKRAWAAKGQLIRAVVKVRAD